MLKPCSTCCPDNFSCLDILNTCLLNMKLVLSIEDVYNMFMDQFEMRNMVQYIKNKNVKTSLCFLIETSFGYELFIHICLHFGSNQTGLIWNKVLPAHMQILHHTNLQFCVDTRYISKKLQNKNTIR